MDAAFLTLRKLDLVPFKSPKASLRLFSNSINLSFHSVASTSRLVRLFRILLTTALVRSV